MLTLRECVGWQATALTQLDRFPISSRGCRVIQARAMRGAQRVTRRVMRCLGLGCKHRLGVVLRRLLFTSAGTRKWLVCVRSTAAERSCGGLRVIAATGIESSLFSLLSPGIQKRSSRRGSDSSRRKEGCGKPQSRWLYGSRSRALIQRRW